MIGVRARLTLREGEERLRLISRPGHPLLLGALGALLLGGLLVAGIPAGAFEGGAVPATIFYILAMLLILTAAGYARNTVADRRRGRLFRFTSLYGLVLPWWRREYGMEELREISLEQIPLVKPAVHRTWQRWEPAPLKKEVALYRMSMRVGGKRISVAETSAPEDLENIASYWAGFLGHTIERWER